MTETPPGVERFNPLRRARVIGSERWVLGPGRHAAWAWIVAVLLGLLLVAYGFTSLDACSRRGSTCSTTEVVAGVGAVVLGVAQIPVTLLLIGTAIVRAVHQHRRSRWEADYHNRLDQIERQASQANADERLRRARDLAEATVEGDFLGERLRVRSDFTTAVASLFLVAASVAVLLALVGFFEEGLEFTLVFLTVGAVPATLALLVRRVARRTRRLAEQATDEHMAELTAALSNTSRAETAPVFQPYAGRRSRPKAAEAP